MPKFSYVAQSEHGNAMNGTMQGSSVDAVTARLKTAGMEIVSIAEVKYEEGVGEQLGRLIGVDPVPMPTLILFTRQMYTLSKAGVPIIEAMKGLADTSKNVALQRAVVKMASDLESGCALAEALEKHPRIFENIYVSVVRVAEFSGRMEEAFAQLAAYLEQKHDTRRKIKSATRYPMFVCLAMVGAVVAVNLFVMPVFAGLFESMDVPLPLLTRAMLGSSDFMVNYWHIVLIVIVGTVLAIRWWKSTDSGAITWDRWKFKIPVMGSIFELATMSRFSRCATMAIRSDVPLIETLALVGDAVDNRYMQMKVLEMRTDVEQGINLSVAAERTEVFTPLILQMLAVGESTGSIDDLLEEVADAYDRDLDFALKRLAESLEPFLIIGIGAMVMMLAIAIFLPMWDFYTIAQDKL